MRDPINILEIEALARESMDPAAYDYLAGGSWDELTLRDNRAAFDRLTLRPRVLVDVSNIDTSVELVGSRVSLPIVLAPTALNRIAHVDAELAAVRAAGGCGTTMVVSTFSSCPLEEIAAAANMPLWFQTYIFRDRAITRDLLRRAEATGYRAIVLTVDTPRLGRRERDVRNGFVLPPDLVPGNLSASTSDPGAARARLRDLHQLPDPSLTWTDVNWLSTVSSLPIVIKGILAAEDAERAVAEGAAGVIVSNHGGRQLDGAVATIDALPAVADAIAGRIPVLLDGGIRRGTDVLKALAAGARAVMIGRPYLWGLAMDGEKGVRRVIDILRDELTLAMALAGCPSVAAIDRSVIAHRPGNVRPGTPRG